MTLLCDLSEKYGSDKGHPHRYTVVYDKFMTPLVDSAKRVLEIGICGERDIKNTRIGASLYMWRDFFPNADIFGVDLDPRWMVRGEDRIHTTLANQGDPSMMALAHAEFGGEKYDVIIDDGSHDPIFQVAAAHIMLPHLADDGYYFIEDIYVDPEEIIAKLPPGFNVKVYEGSKMLPEGYGRRSFGSAPAGEILLVISRRPLSDL